MLRAIFDRLITRLETRWAYDAGYARLLNRVSPWTFLKFSVATQMADRKAAPSAALAAAGLVGTLAEDCGPCTQISIDLASAGGVPTPVLRAILAGDEAGMGEAAALAYRFAMAVLAHSPEADGMREEIVRRWGERGLAAIALTITAARVYPTLKYGLGFGKTCVKVRVGGEAAPFTRRLAITA